jgi:hypothetical protein
MVSSGMLLHVILVRTEVSDECSASIIRVTRIGEIAFIFSVRLLLVTAIVFPISRILVTLIMEALRSFEISVHTTVTRRNIQQDVIIQGFT